MTVREHLWKLMGLDNIVTERDEQLVDQDADTKEWGLPGQVSTSARGGSPMTPRNCYNGLKTSGDVDEFRLGSASTLVVKNYPLDPQNLTSSYFDQLDTAVTDFCTEPSEFCQLINDVFEETYREVFSTEPAGDFSGGLRERHE